MNAPRRLGGGGSPQPAAPAPSTPSQSYGRAPAPQQAKPQQPAGPRAPSFARGGLPPADPSVDTSQRGAGGDREKRDQAYWDAHPLRAGTYDFDAYMRTFVCWSTGKDTLGLQVTQWDHNAGPKGAPGEHHGRPIDWDHSRPDLLDKLATLDPSTEEYGKASRGYAYWRADMANAYAAADLPDTAWPKDSAGNAIIPWWDLLTHQMPDGTIIPVCIRIRVVVQPKRERWPLVQAALKLKTDDGRPFQAPMPYAVAPGVAADFRWNVGETKHWGSDRMHAEVALIDRETLAFPYGNLPTYKDL